MKKKLDVYLRSKSAYQLAQDLGHLPSQIYVIRNRYPDAVVILDADNRPERIDYAIKRSLERRETIEKRS